MNYLIELNHGLKFIRAWLDKNLSDWKKAEISLCFEPDHCMMAVDAVEKDQRIETLDAILTLGVIESRTHQSHQLPIEGSK